MKNRILIVSLAIVSVFLVTSCQSKKQDAKKTSATGSVSVESEKIKDEVLRIVNSLPSNTETVNLINATGAAYLAGFTGEDMNTGNLLTRADKSRAYGTVIFDLAYTNIYNQVESFTKLMKINETLTQDLGFEGLVQIQRDFKEHYQKVKNNSDSVNILVADMLKKTNDLIQGSGSVADISLVCGGAVVKSLNVISYLTLFAPAKDKLLQVLQKQKDVVNAVCQILEKSPSDKDVAKLYQALVPVQKIFNSPDSFTTQTVEEINKLTGFITM